MPRSLFRTCPHCNAKIRSIDTRPELYRVYRRYECTSCKQRLSSIEEFVDYPIHKPHGNAINRNSEHSRLLALQAAIIDLLSEIEKGSLLNETHAELLRSFNKGKSEPLILTSEKLSKGSRLSHYGTPLFELGPKHRASQSQTGSSGPQQRPRSRNGRKRRKGLSGVRSALNDNSEWGQPKSDASGA